MKNGYIESVIESYNDFMQVVEKIKGEQGVDLVCEYYGTEQQESAEKELNALYKITDLLGEIKEQINEII